LCLALFPWASFRATKAAVKLHILLDLRGAIPAVIHISDGTLHDGNVLDLLIPASQSRAPASGWQFLRHQRRVQLHVRLPVLPTCRSQHRIDLQSGRRVDGVLLPATLSRNGGVAYAIAMPRAEAWCS
jgi:hypothetical protein